MSSPMSKNHDRWLKEAKRQKAKYIIDICDTWDYDNYPVYISSDKELKKAKERYSQNMQKIDAIVDVSTGKII